MAAHGCSSPEVCALLYEEEQQQPAVYTSLVLHEAELIVTTLLVMDLLLDFFVNVLICQSFASHKVWLYSPSSFFCSGDTLMGQ